MAKIVCITSGLTGIFNASLELMHRLQLAGHTVIAAAPRPVQALASTVCSEFIKLPYYNYDPAPEVPRFAGPLRKLRRWIYKVRHAAGRKEKAMQNLGMQCFAEMISEFRADLYLVDVEMHEYIITLHHKKCPFILLSQWFSLSRDVGQAPLVTAIIPGQGWAGSKIGLWTSWQILSISRWWVFLKKRVRAA